MKTNDVTFIGGGNMACAMVKGMVDNDYPSGQITVIDRNPEKCEALEKNCQIQTASAVSASIKDASIIVLSVKPQVAEVLCKELAALMQDPNTLIISVMAGLKSETLQKWLGGDYPIVRAMPNTPAQCGLGATGAFANESVSAEQRQFAESILGANGLLSWLDSEAQIDVIAALSGSGPAYFFYFIELMAKTAQEMGLPQALADSFAIQTALGAATLADQSDESPQILR